MSKFIIRGGIPLHGEVTIAGNKNAALPIIAATALTDAECTLENVPDIRDVDAILAIVENLGKTVERIAPNTVKISGGVKSSHPADELARRLRASILFMGALLAKTGEAFIAPPGGCVIGRRGLESHFSGFEKMGAKVELQENVYYVSGIKNEPVTVYLPEPSVTATENLLLVAAARETQTTIYNAACEPHISDLANVLVKMGAKIDGIDSNRLVVQGTKNPTGFTHRIVPDYIETGTFAIAAAATNGIIRMHDVRRDQMILTDYHLKKLAVKLHYADEHELEVRRSALPPVLSRKVQVGPWPGFPTDLMSPLIVLATQITGTTLCHDWMFESRMFFVDKLIVMGAEVTLCDPHRGLVTGPTPLRGQNLSSPDIRAGIALVIAALASCGESIIDKAELVDRGYENIVERLQKLGGDIERID